MSVWALLWIQQELSGQFTTREWACWLPAVRSTTAQPFCVMSCLLHPLSSISSKWKCVWHGQSLLCATCVTLSGTDFSAHCLEFIKETAQVYHPWDRLVSHPDRMCWSEAIPEHKGHIGSWLAHLRGLRENIRCTMLTLNRLRPGLPTLTTPLTMPSALPSASTSVAGKLISCELWLLACHWISLNSFH